MRNEKYTGNVKTEVLEYTDEEGVEYFIERFETAFRASEIDSSEKYKIGCEPCKKYGRNLACPPYSPYLLDYIKECRAAKIICFRIPLEQFPGTITEERYHAAFRKVQALLSDELLRYRQTGHIVAGSGTCLACGQCAIESGDTQCTHPSKRIYSLESLGVNVVSLIEKAFHLRLEWSGCDTAADFVSAVGAVFSVVSVEL
jgi:predicted metal-binding protein